MSALLVAVLLLEVQDLRQASKPCPYIVVTVGGARIGSLDPPNHDGKPVKFRDCGNKALTLVPASEVDWDATAKANAPDGRPAATPTPLRAPTRSSLSSFAKENALRDADEAVARNQTLSGKLKVGGREISLDRSAPFFGSESVAQHLQLGTFVADTSGCPDSRARAYGTVKNVSRMKLRGLKALVVIGSLRTGDLNGQVQSMDPSDLVPGEEAEIYMWLSCDWASRAGAGTSRAGIIVLLPDVAGRTEEVARPDGSNPFEKLESSKAAPAAKTPAASTAGSAPPKPRG